MGRQHFFDPPADLVEDVAQRPVERNHFEDFFLGLQRFLGLVRLVSQLPMTVFALAQRRAGSFLRRHIPRDHLNRGHAFIQERGGTDLDINQAAIATHITLFHRRR